MGTGYDSILNSDAFTISGNGQTIIRSSHTSGIGISYTPTSMFNPENPYTGMHLNLAFDGGGSGNVTGYSVTSGNARGGNQVNGVLVTTGGVHVSGGTQNGLNVIAQGVGAGTLNGLNIGSITAGLGTEQGILIGTGWDVGIVSNSRMTVSSDIASNYAATFFNDGNATTRFGIQVQAGLDDNTTASPSTLIQFADGNGTSIGSITFGSSLVAYNTTSDRRLKENIVDTNLGIDALMQLQVRDYNWKADADHSTLTQGFVAQELFEVYPQAVTVPTDPEQYWMIDYSKLTPLIISAVQDQQAQINTLFTGSDSPFNLSEKYRTLDGAIEAGDIVSLVEDESATIKRAKRGETILGVVSDEPGLLLNQAVVDGSPVAVSGHVAVKVNMEGGEIAVGDAITLSSVQGVGTKATTTGDTIGIALEATSTPGTLRVYVRNQTYFSQSAQASLAQLFSLPANAEDDTDTLWSRLATLAHNFVDGVLTIAGVKTDRVEVNEELCVDGTCINGDDLRALLEEVGRTSSESSTPEPDPDPFPSPPDLVPEPIPEEPIPDAPIVEPAV